MRKFSGSLILIFFGLITTANVHADGMSHNAFNLAAFELSGVFVSQGSNQNTNSAELAWVPAYWINTQWAVRGNFGVSAFRATDIYGNHSNFTVFDVEALVRYMITPNYDVEAGGGVQTWVNQGGGQGVVSVNVGYHPSAAWLGFLDRVFIGYSDAFQNVNASEFRVGLGASF